MGTTDVRWIQRFNNFKRAFARLAQADALAKQRHLSDLEKQGLIQAFEFTHELAWNTLKDFLEARGTTAGMYGSRDATREAFAVGLIDNGDAWMQMIDHRNQTSHTYDEKIADAIVAAILTSYVAEFEAFHHRLLELERKDAR